MADGADSGFGGGVGGGGHFAGDNDAGEDAGSGVGSDQRKFRSYTSVLRSFEYKYQEAWHLVTSAFLLCGRHLVTSAFVLCGRRGTYGSGLGLVTALVAAAWQAWPLVTSALLLCGRRGTYGTGLALRDGLGRGWSRVKPRLFCVAGVALGDICLRFVWQAWLLQHWAGSGDGLGVALAGVALTALGWLWRRPWSRLVPFRCFCVGCTVSVLCCAVDICGTASTAADAFEEVPKTPVGPFGTFDGWQTAGLNGNKKLLMWLWCLCLRSWGAKNAFGAFWNWQTAGLNGKKKLLMWLWCLCLRSWRCQKRLWGFLELANGRLERQEKAIDVALVPLPAELGVPKTPLGPFGTSDGWQTAGLNGKKKLLMWLWCLCLRSWGAKNAFGAF
eukprot:s473_g8.t1